VSATARAGLQLAGRVSARGFDVELTVRAGETVAVLGPNGAGKSTLLNIVAGLIRMDAGYVRLGERTLDDTSKFRTVPPYRRSVGLLAQEPLLFPHLSVRANVAFGPRSAGMPRRRAGEAARHWLTEVDAVALADRKPSRLSGGQAQRVAVARALACDPELLLLDEPFAALDVNAAPALRALLRRVLAHRTALLVTHDIVDVLTLADRVVVLEAGRIVEQGAVREVLARPRSAFAASIAGVNMLVGTATRTGLEAAGLTVSGLVEPSCVAGVPAAAVFSPAAVAIYRDKPAGSPRNVCGVRVIDVESRGGVIRVHAATATDIRLIADITVPAAAELALTAGDEVYFTVKATEVAVYARPGAPDAG
jgi:molybdate transport system ATP-binding protein